MCMQFPQPPCSTTVHVPSNARQNRIDTPTKQEVLKGLSLPLLRLLLHWGVSCSFSSSSPNGAVMFVPPRSQETWHCSSFRYACSLQPPEQLTSTGKFVGAFKRLECVSGAFTRRQSFQVAFVSKQQSGEAGSLYIVF